MQKPLFLMCLLLAACSSGGTATTSSTPITEPRVVVERWLAAAAEGEAAALERLVEPVGLAVIAGVENQLRSDELVGLLERGLTGQVAVEYWAAFRDDFAAIRGLSLADLETGSESPLSGTAGFVAVEVSTPDSAGEVILRISEGAGWQVDMAASIGPALVGPLAEYLASALEGEHAATIGDAYRRAIIPALDAAIVNDPDNADLVFETEFIRQLLQAAD